MILKTKKQKQNLKWPFKTYPIMPAARTLMPKEDLGSANLTFSELCMEYYRKKVELTNCTELS